MDPETRSKIEETVMDVLKRSNLEEMTEFKVRVTASERLGFDLSGSQYKGFVRTLVESYLLADAEEEEKQKQRRNVEQVKEGVGNIAEVTPAVVQPKKELNDDGDLVICQLSQRRKVEIRDFRGKSFVSIREYYQKEGKECPSSKGTSLTTEQWSVVYENIPHIEEAIKKMQAKLRSEVDDKQVQASDPKTEVAPPPQFLPCEINRFDGKDFHTWVQKMEAYLQQMKVAYVLTDPCPDVAIGLNKTTEEIAQAKAAEQRWLNDDYMCRRNILICLSDHLFYKYGNKKLSAKELWEELKLVYLDEEFGTKRSQVKKYIEFQMVDGNTIYDQVQDLNNLADSIVASGIIIDENFHVSAILSKLPPSWKDFSVMLTREECLPFWTLMERIKMEVESRYQARQEDLPVNADYHQGFSFGSKITNRNPSSMYKKSDAYGDRMKMVCENCGKKGHLTRNCRRKFNKEYDGKKIESDHSAARGTNLFGARRHWSK